MAAVTSAQQSQAVQSGDLTDLVSSSTSATVYPSDDTILSVLQARFRQDLPYSRVGSTNYIAVNPYKTLANVNDFSSQEYEERSYKDTSLPLPSSAAPLPPHLYDIAARVYLLMRRRNESQSIIFRCVVMSCLARFHTDDMPQRYHRLRKDRECTARHRPSAQAVFSFKARIPRGRANQGSQHSARLLRQCEDAYEPQRFAPWPLSRAALH